MTVNRPTLVVSNIVIVDDKVLLCKRVDTGLWETPGGKVEGELLLHAARREMLEETRCLLCGTPQIVGVYNDEVEWVVVFFRWGSYLYEPWNAEPEKCLEVSWFELDQLPGPAACMPGLRWAIKNGLLK